MLIFYNKFHVSYEPGGDKIDLAGVNLFTTRHKQSYPYTATAVTEKAMLSRLHGLHHSHSGILFHYIFVEASSNWLL